jgi:hypothetical protein
MWMWVPVRFHSSVVCWGCASHARVVRSTTTSMVSRSQPCRSSATQHSALDLPLRPRSFRLLPPPRIATVLAPPTPGPSPQTRSRHRGAPTRHKLQLVKSGPDCPLRQCSPFPPVASPRLATPLCSLRSRTCIPHTARQHQPGCAPPAPPKTSTPTLQVSLVNPRSAITSPATAPALPVPGRAWCR